MEPVADAGRLSPLGLTVEQVAAQNWRLPEAELACPYCRRYRPCPCEAQAEAFDVFLAELGKR